MRILIRYFFRALRALLTPFLLLGDKLTTPKGIERDPADQARVDTETSRLALYQFPACPFCIKTRRAIRRLSLKIELRNAQPEGEHRTELLEGGGKVQVPCLRIRNTEGQEEWMYESRAIIDYLEARFRPTQTAE